MRSQNFYHKFLNLPPELTQPDHYQLLGLEPFTDNPVAIKKAAIERNALLRGWDNSRYFREAEKVLDDVVIACFVLQEGPFNVSAS